MEWRVLPEPACWLRRVPQYLSSRLRNPVAGEHAQLRAQVLDSGRLRPHSDQRRASGPEGGRRVSCPLQRATLVGLLNADDLWEEFHDSIRYLSILPLLA